MSLPRFRSDRIWNCPSMAGRAGPLLNLLEHLKPLTVVEAPRVTTGMKVTDLPNDILTSLPHYLECLDDWYATIRTCRRFYHTCASTRATFPAFFTRRHKDGLLPVHIDLLMAGSARQVADWAVKNQQTRQELQDATGMEGDEGLLKLGVEIARWSIEDVRALHEADVKIIEPLGKAIAAKRGATHRQHCRAARTFDRLTTSDEDDEECGLCTDLRLVRASIYSFVVYCNLFHADIEEACGQLPMKVGLLGSESRGYWMKHRMWQYDWDGQDVTWSRLNILADNPRRLRVYFDTQSSDEHVGEKERNRRFKLFLRIMDHQGLDTLRFMLSDGALAKDSPSIICSKVWALPLEQLSNKKVWDSGKLRTRKQIGWFSMACDEKEHRRQSRRT